MEEIDPNEVAEVLLGCARGLSGYREIGIEDLPKEIERLKEERFSGAICVSSKERDISSCNWIVLCDGDVKLMLSQAVRPVPSEEDLRGIGRGEVRVFDFNSYQVERLRSILGEAAVPPPEHLRREEIMRKYRLKEPAEEYIDAILRGYREPTPEERRRCEEMILTIKRDLSEMFGEKMAERMFDKQFRSLGIDKYNMTAKDIGTLLDSLQHTILTKLLGAKRAEEAVRKIKKKAFKIA